MLIKNARRANKWRNLLNTYFFIALFLNRYGDISMLGVDLEGRDND